MRKLALYLIIILFNLPAFATHNRAGEITYIQLSSFTFEFTITTYTNTKPTSDGIPPADRPTLPIQWGDGTYTPDVPRVQIVELPDYIRKNTYVATHTYAGAGTFEIMVEDPNRNEGVNNIPNSVQTVFSIKTILQINPVLGFNSAPILLNPPVDKAAVGKKFIHNPAAYDQDGDSLSYEMTICTGENGEPIENYQFPASSNVPIYIEPSGNLVWDTPVEAGAYNIAFNIFEWRQGVKIGRITRDMQIQVYETDNTPPKLTKIEPFCIEAGKTLNLIIEATDAEGETITLTASGGIFNLDESATFTTTPTAGTASGELVWQTNCNHVRQQPYHVIFKAEDDNIEVNLVDQISVDITVIAPAPKNLQLQSTSNAILLSWDDYACNNQQGFNIYRSTTSYGFNPDSCETGVPPYTGFSLIGQTNYADTNKYLDNNNEQGLAQGYEYCYMITARFNDILESKASNEACGQLIRGIPIITKVSVEKHDSKNGEIQVNWSKPAEFDTNTFPGPLIYIVQRAKGIWGTNFQNIDTLYNFDSDTTYTDKNLNTLTDGYAYKVAIHNSEGLTEQPMTASSVFPKLYGANHRIAIDIQKNVPWMNTEYHILRKAETENNFVEIGTAGSNHFTDTLNVKNNMPYCYRITSAGSYDLPEIVSPLINLSHQNCGMAIDTTPPGRPVLTLDADCKSFNYLLQWTIPDDVIEIRSYNIYFVPALTGQLQLIDSVLINTQMYYNYNAEKEPSGCFAITAVDSSYNESQFSNKACADNCSYYELPNVFTPNNDNKNDILIPTTPPDVIDNFIDRIDLKIYSRWGNLIYETTNPKIEWDGKSKQANKLVSDGVYYYVCDVYEKRITGIEQRTLLGFIHIFSSNDSKASVTE